MPLKPTLRHAGAGRYLRPGGPWDVPSLDALLSAAGGAGDKIVDGSTRLTAAGLESQVAAMAGALRARSVRRGDAVAWQLPNCLEAVLLFRACWRLGAVAVPVHHGAGEADLAAALAQVEPRVVLTGPEDVDGLSADTSAPVSPSCSPQNSRPAGVRYVSSACTRCSSGSSADRVFG